MSTPTPRQRPARRRPINIWDETPTDIKLQIYHHTDPLTLFLNNLLTQEQIKSTYGTKIWEAAFKMDWTGDLSILPQDHFPTSHKSLVLVHSKKLYQKLCEMKPSLTKYTINYSFDDQRSKFTSWLYTAIFKFGLFNFDLADQWKWQEGELTKFESQLIHIPMRQNWTDKLPKFIFSSNEAKIRLLAIAGYFGHIQLVQTFIETIPPNHEDLILSLEFALEGSCSNGHEDMGKYHDWINGSNMRNVLKDAIRSRQSDAVKHVLTVMEPLAMDISVNDHEAIRLACQCSGDNIDIVKLLLGYNNGNAAAIDIHYPISTQSRIVDRVLGRFPNFNQYRLSSNYHNYSAIENAAAYGNLNILKFLLQVNKLDPKTTLVNNYLLLEAAGRGHAEMVSYLLSNTNLDPTFEDSITLVVSCDFPAVVQVLLKDGRSSNRPFYQAAIEHRNIDVVKLLLDSGRLNLTVEDIDRIWNETSFENNDKLLPIFKLLLEHCPALFTDATPRFNRMFEIAARHGDLTTLKGLLTIDGVDPGANDNAAIRAAVYIGQTETVKFLVGLDGVDAGAKNNEAILRAVEDGNLEIVRILVAVDGVDPLVNDGEALKKAAEFPEIVELLTSCSRERSIKK
ncbi:hypothetical protein HDU76_013499 [Blyttiomyces sp. JEL0837]|nr:hypothetical protein HDU76_013499 [Blyttiomyces sp. JEL0837]